MKSIRPRPALLLPLLFAGCAGSPAPDPPGPPEGSGPPPLVDPGSGPWEPVPAAQVAQVCRFDPALLLVADQVLMRPFAVVRYGRLCHEFYPDGDPEAMAPAWSATKTLGALALGAVAYRTRDLPRTTRRTGPLSDLDRVDHWLDSFSFNKDALLAHVLAMVAHNRSLAFGDRRFGYDGLGTGAINRLSDIMNAAIAQDPERLGANLEVFVQRFLFGPLGLRRSVWSESRPDKILGYSRSFCAAYAAGRHAPDLRR
jgi:hypothetical protein